VAGLGGVEVTNGRFGRDRGSPDRAALDGDPAEDLPRRSGSGSTRESPSRVRSGIIHTSARGDFSPENVIFGTDFHTILVAKNMILGGYLGDLIPVSRIKYGPRIAPQEL
jgi:hypothetical protein